MKTKPTKGVKAWTYIGHTPIRSNRPYAFMVTVGKKPKDYETVELLIIPLPAPSPKRRVSRK